MAKKKASEDITRFSFRLEADAAEELQRQAMEAQISRHLHARDLVVAALYAQDEQKHDFKMLRTDVSQMRADLKILRNLADEVKKLRTELGRDSEEAKLLAELRRDLATSVNLLLVKAGKLTQQDALKWVQKTLASK